MTALPLLAAWVGNKAQAPPIYHTEHGLTSPRMSKPSRPGSRLVNQGNVGSGPLPSRMSTGGRPAGRPLSTSERVPRWRPAWLAAEGQ